MKNSIWINPGEDINGNGKFDPWPANEQIDGVSGDLNNIDDDGNGITDDIIGYDFVNQQTANIGDWKNYDPVPIDEYGHGTLVSGIIAAERNNNKGVVGLAYNSKIMNLRCFDITGQGKADNIATAIIYGTLNGVKVFNLSFGEKYNSSLMQDAIDFAVESGCIVVASAGNEGSDSPHYPSDYEGVVSVGYSGQDQRRNSFSNIGSRLDLLAPGVSILTTAFTGGYREASGSSMSAPFVSATAAMLLELNPGLNPYDVSGIIINSASKVDNDTWNIYYGAGNLNVNNALNFTGITNLYFTSPKDEAIFNKDEVNEINFTGNIIVPLMEDYELYLGEGYNPENWEKTGKFESQIKNDTIYTLNISKLKDTSYTFRILINKRNYRTLEKRIRFNVRSNSDKLAIKYVRIVPVFFNDRRILLVGIATNYPSVVKVSLGIDNEIIATGFTDNLKRMKYHVIPVDYDFVQGTTYSFVIEAAPEVKGKYTTQQKRYYTYRESRFSTDKFIKKKYTTTLSYIYNKTADFNSDGKTEYVANDLSHGIWQGTNVYQFDNNQMQKRDSTKQIRLPVGLGDSNGDGIEEVFTRNVGSAVLYQAKSPEHSLFSNILFSDTTSGNFFAGTMHDFTGDGLEELVVYSDTAFYIISYQDNRYKTIATAMLDGELKRFGTAPGLACGDFDGDGFQELAFGNEYGNIFIFEFKNNELNLEYSNTDNYSFSPQYMTTADVNNDGIPEIAIANFGTEPVFGGRVNAEPVWSLKILKSKGINNYGYIFGEYFYGVKQGSTPAGVFFRNGISAGNIGTRGDAVLMSPFPNMYIFVWDETDRKMKPFWYYPAAFANSAIIYDFDKNGINEFGFPTGQLTEFFEYVPDSLFPNAPVELNGWSVNDKDVYVKWRKVQKDNSADIEKYFLFYGIEENGYIKILGTAETNGQEYTFKGLTAPTDYWVGIASISPSGMSSDTIIKKIHHHIPIEPVEIKQINRRRFLFKFSGKVSMQLPPSDIISYYQTDTLVSNVITCTNDSTLAAYWEKPLAAGDGKFIIRSFRDYYYAPSKPSAVDVIITEDVPSPDELYLKNVVIKSYYELDLEYSEPPVINDALDIANYILQPTGETETINTTANPSIFNIQFDKNSPIGPLGKQYSITVRNVKSQSNKPMTEGAGNTISFSFQANDLSNVFVYPNPVRLSQDNEIYFANLTNNAEVTIYDLEGREIISLVETNGTGGILWNGRDKNGNFLKTGIYLYRP